MPATPPPGDRCGRARRSGRDAMNLPDQLRLLGWPPIEPTVRAHLGLPNGAPFVVVDCTLDDLGERLQAADLAVLRVDALPPEWPLSTIAARLPTVVLFDPASDPARWTADAVAAAWNAATEAGAQDLLSTADLLAPAAGPRLRAAVLRHRIAVQARSAYATDLATGLPHRQQLLEHMNHLLALREREPAPMALLVLNVEGVATALERLGDEAAGVLRRKLAVRLRSGLRASDVVAALDGDDFAVLLSWVDEAAHVEGVVAKLLASMRRPFMIGGQPITLAVCIGAARYPEDGSDADSLLDFAALQARARRGAGGARPVHLIAPAANDDSAG